jgi:hypothetical protein
LAVTCICDDNKPFGLAVFRGKPQKTDGRRPHNTLQSSSIRSRVIRYNELLSRLNDSQPRDKVDDRLRANKTDELQTKQLPLTSLIWRRFVLTFGERHRTLGATSCERIRNVSIAGLRRDQRIIIGWPTNCQRPSVRPSVASTIKTGSRIES